MDEKTLEGVLDTVSDGVYFLDVEHRVTYWSRGAERLTGFTADEVVGRSCSENILVHVDGEGTNLCHGHCPVARCLNESAPQQSEAYLHHKEGHRMPVRIQVIPLHGDDGELCGAAEVFSDLTPKVATSERVEELERLALLDPLTEVGNRRYLEMQLAARFDEAHRYGWQFGVLFVDIDHFKRINDEHGHNVGDRVLKMVSRTMQNALRSFDLVGRWGGEEFLALVVNLQSPDLVTVANKLRLLVQHSSLDADGQTVQVSVSIGATMATVDDSAESLLARADRLMYQAKQGGRNRISF